jgi:hypothetical protein
MHTLLDSKTCHGGRKQLVVFENIELVQTHQMSLIIYQKVFGRENTETLPINLKMKLCEIINEYYIAKECHGC